MIDSYFLKRLKSSVDSKVNKLVDECTTKLLKTTGIEMNQELTGFDYLMFIDELKEKGYEICNRSHVESGGMQLTLKLNGTVVDGYEIIISDNDFGFIVEAKPIPISDKVLYAPMA